VNSVLAERILEIEGSGGSGPEKLRRLLAGLTADDLAGVAGQWIRQRGDALFWEDNLLDWAQARIAL
jgi:ABC-type transport system involved in cytochrome c biogenesis ATPase subunit